MQLWQPHTAPGAAPTASTTVSISGTAGDVVVELSGASEATSTRVGEDVWLIEARSAEGISAQWRIPCVSVSAFWTPDSGTHRWVPPSWRAPKTSSLALGAPAISLIGTADVNVCTVALADGVGEVRFSGGVVEETGEYLFIVEQASGSLSLRIDLSDRPFSAALAEVAAWWGQGRQLPPTPRAARLPAYSTWYSMHQEISEESVEVQARLSRELGCETIIVDDGWQTADRGRGYAFCGDWEPNPAAFPDFSEHVKRVHALGLSYLLWYAIPFVGKENAAFARFEDKLLMYADYMDAGVLDPRFPDVREFIVDRLSQAVEAWGMDGLKIDFVDWFARANPPARDGMDCPEVAEGVRRLLDALDARLRRAKPDVLIEHRQPYTSPGLWPYANMIRAVDCPLSPQENRQRTIDLRLLGGPLAVHSDMILWHAAEPPQQVAVHLINALFSVPQISVDLTRQTGAQRAALAFWLGVFREHLDTLQLGALEPTGAEHGFPLVRAYDEKTTIIARYAPLPVRVPGEGWQDFLVANADSDPAVLLIGEADEQVAASVHDCEGALVSSATLSLGPGVTTVDVPTGGLLRLRRTNQEG
ncbi:glycoside hydrolase family 36 protein [Nonomuraea sp. NPDC000554]|uniref:glycoside hydrolase family 36 protein n=1 Tax=Nonomuraea sp. NPDC000554 TaxID=3154259 RepID=UPI003329F3F6